MAEKICPVCGKSFTLGFRQTRRVYCSEECRNIAQENRRKCEKEKEKIYHSCEWCGVGLPKNSTDKYCSDECRRKAERNSTQKKSGRKKKPLSIDDIVKLAKKEGLSYGQYVDKYGR